MAEFKVGVLLEATGERFRKGMRTAKRVAKDTFDSIRKEAREAVKGIRNVDKAADDMGGSVSKGMNRASNAFGNFQKLIRGLVVVEMGRQFLTAAKNVQQLEKGLTLVTGSSEDARDEMEFVRQTANELGIDVAAAGNAYLSLAAAAKGTTLEGEGSRQIFTAISQAMGKLGKSSADTSGALLAVQQMISKGKVSAEELRGQLGERLPGAFQAAARAMGVTTAELDKLLQSGNLTAEELLPKLADELNKTFDTGEKVTGLTASWNRFVNTISNASSSVEDSVGIMALLGKGIDLVSSTLAVVSVGFVTISEKVQATAKAIGAFWDLLSKKTSLTGFQNRVDEAFENASKNISETAERLFSLDSNLQHTGEEAELAGDKLKKGMDKGKEAVGKTKDELDAAAEAAKLVDESLASLGVTAEGLAAGLDRSTLESLDAFNRLMIHAADNSALLVTGIQKAAAGANSLDVLRVMAFQVAEAVDKGRLSDEQAAIVKKTLVDEAQRVADSLRAAGVSAEEVKKQTDQMSQALREVPGDVPVNITVKTTNTQALTETKDKTKEVSKAQGEQAETAKAAGDATEKAGEQMSGAGGIMAKMIETMSAARATMKGLSDGALEMFESLMRVYAQSQTTGIIHKGAIDEIKSLHNELQQLEMDLQGATNGIGKWFKMIEINMVKTEIAFRNQTKEAELAIAQMDRWGENHNAMSGNIVKQAQSMANSYDLLDDQTLSKLEREIDRITAANERMEASAERALQRYQDMIDQQSGNDLGIAERERSRELVELQKALDQARKTGNQEAVADLEQALVLARRYHNEEINQIKLKTKQEQELNRVRQDRLDIVDRERESNAWSPTDPNRTLPAGQTPPADRQREPWSPYPPNRTLPASPVAADAPGLPAGIPFKGLRLEINNRNPADLYGDEESINALVESLQEAGARAI